MSPRPSLRLPAQSDEISAVSLGSRLPGARDAPGHPERPARSAAIEWSLAERGRLGYKIRQAPPASRELLVAVHSAENVDAVRSMSDRGGGAFDEENIVREGSYRAAAHASGAACAMVEAVLAEAGPRVGFSANRPPGHHARADTTSVRILPVQPRCGRDSLRTGLTGRTTPVDLRLGRGPRRRNQRHLPRHQRRAAREHPPSGAFPGTGRIRTRERSGERVTRSTCRSKKDRTRTRGSRCSSTS